MSFKMSNVFVVSYPIKCNLECPTSYRCAIWNGISRRQGIMKSADKYLILYHMYFRMTFKMQYERETSGGKELKMLLLELVEKK